ncbi:hypothetical protein SDC9_186130 [bioreactor metagenome]|uniref:Uncharacterized protein n=1 Tax=bioreactor metagenome TaxID=1076179 RepID=A0A645HJ22_9ZZZZ
MRAKFPGNRLFVKYKVPDGRDHAHADIEEIQGVHLVRTGAGAGIGKLGHKIVGYLLQSAFLYQTGC